MRARVCVCVCVCVMPHSEHCDDAAREQYDATLRKYELAHDNLSMAAVFGTSTTIFFSIFSTMIYTNVSGTFAPAQMGWFVLLMLTFVIAIFMAIELLVRTDVLFHVYKNHQTRFFVLVQNGQAARTIGMFLVTTFLTSIWLASWNNSHFNWLEKLCGIWNVFMAINVLLLFLRK